MKRYLATILSGGLVAGLGLVASEAAPAEGVTLGASPAGDTAILADGGVAAAIEALPALVGDVMERSGVPGMAVAVVHEGETVFLEGFGVRHLGTGAPVNANTVFQIASVSKSISATIAAIAVSQGRLAWNDSVSSHLPGFSLSDPYVAERATIGDFFAHRSGLPAAAGDELEDLGFDRQTIIERLALVPLDPFRISYNYANYGTTIAAEAVASAYGETWETLAEELLFAPLGMEATSYRHSDYLTAPDRAHLHAFEDGAFQPLYDRQPDAQAPAGGVSSTVGDLARWLALLLAGGHHEGEDIFSPDALLPALRPQVINAPAGDFAERSGAYGFGFNVSVSATGRPTMNHSGAFMLGAGTHFQIMPEQKLGLVVLSNGAPVGAVEAIGNSFMDIVQFGTVTRDWYEAYNSLMSVLFEPVGDLAGQEPPQAPEAHAPLDSYTGSFESAYFGPAEITVEDGELMLSLGPTPLAFLLQHWDGHVFALAPRNENAPAGSLSSVRFNHNGTRATGLVVDYLDENGLGHWD
ncbi:serine hydrolase [Pelagibacterium sp. H642]|uniref:serine hydrolase n=1 Tax=Pelagibacterium sp. H642 TaxID=1881069 RepID=UPI0028161C75|nr:serine hydrolase [Pelagibacterium sp. H642]WMT92684.1 serine hydrolase [Pelagibacterium sp. H642]